MADDGQKMMEEILQETTSSLANAHTLARIAMFFAWDPDKKTGVAVNEIAIEYLEVTESIFDLLPAIHVRFNNTGIANGVYVPRTGDNIHLIITRTAGDEDQQHDPAVEADFAIQEVHKDITMSNDLHITNYEILGVLDKQLYLNQHCVYPQDDIVNKASVIAQTAKYMLSDVVVPSTHAAGNVMPAARSDEVVQKVCDEMGIPLIKETEGKDSGFWCCANDTYAHFLRKVVDHAWIDSDDAPLIYIDINGDMHYTSLQKLATRTAFVQRDADEDKTYAKTETKFICKTSGITPESEDEVLYNYTDIVTLNGSGSIINKGGLKVKQGFFSPFPSDQVTDTWTIHSGDSFVSGTVEKILSFLGIEPPSSFQRKNESEYAELPMLADFDNRPTLQTTHYLGCYNGGMLFPEMHQYYAIAPKHNELIRRAFFQTFIKMTVDVSWQPPEYLNKDWQPKLGTVVNVDASNAEYKETVTTGKYIVGKIVHKYVPFASYTQIIYGVTDGTYSLGQIKQDGGTDE